MARNPIQIARRDAAYPYTSVNIAENIGDWEEQLRPAQFERTDLAHLGSDKIRNH